MEDYLGKLNAVQHKAVTNEAQYLQILAGPGSGKTRVLTSRVAFAVKQLHHHPRRIVVVTFTNKAAREMRNRLEAKELLGTETSNALFMGTFHSICGRLLRRHAERIDLKKNFLIADTDMSKHLIKKLKVELKPHLSDFAISKLTPDAFYNEFSKHKNMGMKLEDYVEKYRDDFTKRDYIKMFVAYENRLKAENLVDFDNLLLFARDLLRTSPHVADFIQHVLVDEFQDTNAVQYDIVKLLTPGRKKYLTICGDPDQSIFGWRCAVKENFLKMQEDYPSCQVENLEQNYRSTKKILEGAFSVITQDKDRIEKALSTDNCTGVPTSLLRMASDMLEAQSIAEEINRIIKFSNGLITYDDIAILVRMNFLSRSLEQTFHAAGIPYAIVGGVQFFEREEIKDIIAYLRVIYNPNDTTAFERIINKPRRGIGEVTLDRIQRMSLRRDWDVVRVLEEVAQGNANLSLSGKVKRNIHEFLTMYHDVRQMMMDKEPISAMISHIVNAIDYKAFLNNTHDKGGESRWDNVGELITLAKQSFDKGQGPTRDDFSTSQPNGKAITAIIDEMFPDDLSDSSTEDGLSDLGSSQQPLKPTLPVQDHPLVAQAVDEYGEEEVDRVALFLEATSLEPSQGGDEDEEGNKSSKVTISTLHSAKGLEWPVVFIMGCEEGFIPHTKGDTNEEIRLLYVGMTRAQCFLYCTHAYERASWGNLEERQQSSFLKKMPEETFTKNTPQWNRKTRTWVAGMLGRNVEEPTKELKDDGQMVWLPEERTRGNYGPRSYGGRNDSRAMGSWRPGGSAKFQSKSATLAKPVKMSTEQAMASPYASFGSASQLLGSSLSSSGASMPKKKTSESSEIYSYAYVKTDPDAATLHSQMHKHAKRSSTPLPRQTKKKK